LIKGYLLTYLFTYLLTSDKDRLASLHAIKPRIYITKDFT